MTDRPEPKVGQVWLTSGGEEFIVADKYGDIFKLLYTDCADGCMLAIGTVAEDDTYVGQFRGFKVEGCDANR